MGNKKNELVESSDENFDLLVEYLKMILERLDSLLAKVK